MSKAPKNPVPMISASKYMVETVIGNHNMPEEEARRYLTWLPQLMPATRHYLPKVCHVKLIGPFSSKTEAQSVRTTGTTVPQIERAARPENS